MIRHEATGRMVRRGGLRYPGGWLPEIGTILGPHDGEYLTVVAHEDGRALLSPATGPDFVALRERTEARSMAEVGLLALGAGR
jgi:hypothetical protein